MGSLSDQRPGLDPVADLVARAEIEQLLVRRGRAADAKDPDAIVRQHVPGSRDTHGIFDGTIEEFGEYLRTHNYSDPRYGPQRHTVSNVLIELISSSAARAESYHIAYHRIELPTGSYDVYIGGRYLDRCELVGGRWLLSSRTVIYDWSRSSNAGDLTTGSDTHD
jgi:SnoaL-like domain